MATVVFDLDGTLADTSADLIAAANHCFEGAGVGAQLRWPEDAGHALQGGRRMLSVGFERAGRGGEPALLRRWHPPFLDAYRNAIAEKTRLFPGCLKALEALRVAGYRLAVCTNKPEGLARLLLERLGVREHFDSLVGGDTLRLAKPDPLPLQEAVRRAGGDVDGPVVLVGDSSTDRATAQAAGALSILVAFAPSGEDMAALKPDALLPDFAALPALVQRLMPLPEPQTPARVVFAGSFTQQAPLGQEAIDAALAVLAHGRLHRYNVEPGEVGEVALLEQEFARACERRYCLAVASGGYALATALRALEVMPGERVLTNAFTLAPVPGAIASVGARPVFVETTADLVIDFADLERKLEGARALMLSHMRGHICDMDRLMRLCETAGVPVIEDCAHTMGARWNGVISGNHGVMACYSTQTYKHLNSGEGGLLTSDDPALMARATLLSGSYMLYPRHGAAPGDEHFDALRTQIPNVSGRMDNLRAAILRPQLARLDEAVARWNQLYQVVENGLRGVDGLSLISRPPQEAFVGSSFQFSLPGWDAPRIEALVNALALRGVEVKWFGAPEPHGFTSRYVHWAYAQPEALAQTDGVLSALMDLRLPLSFTPQDCAVIAQILREEVAAG